MKADRVRALARFFLVQRFKGFDVPVAPLFDDRSTSRFLELLDQCSSYLEYGSGGSTIAAARRGIPAISVENDRYYAAAVRKALPESHQLLYLTPSIGLSLEWGWPAFRRPRWLKRRQWRAYVEAPFAHIGRAFPDFILVDGRFRIACALESSRRAALFGASAILMFDDYAHRPAYHVVERWLGRPEMIGRAAFFTIGSARIEAEDVEAFLMNPA